MLSMVTHGSLLRGGHALTYRGAGGGNTGVTGWREVYGRQDKRWWEARLSRWWEPGEIGKKFITLHNIFQ